jgi:hypothetical protein
MKNYVYPSNMRGALGSGAPMVSSKSRVEVEDSGDVDSKLNIINDDSEVLQSSPSTPPETHWHNSLRFLSSSRFPATSNALKSRFDEASVEFFPDFRMENKGPCFHADSIHRM